MERKRGEGWREKVEGGERKWEVEKESGRWRKKGGGGERKGERWREKGGGVEKENMEGREGGKGGRGMVRRKENYLEAQCPKQRFVALAVQHIKYIYLNVCVVKIKKSLL